MHETNIIIQESPKELNDLKKRIYSSKRKRIDMIDGFLNKLQTELNKRDLKDIPTPMLAKMVVSFADQAKKEQPTIELKYQESIFDSQRVTF
jgi:hypothetical protein